MIQNLIATLKQRLPLTIVEALWSDPVLSLVGHDWSFNTTSTWRLVSEHRLLSGSEDDNAQDAIKSLVGVEIVACEPMSSSPALDPRFILANGARLEVFSATATEPWVLKLSDGPTYVASPSA